jgi:hypothetical protein
MVNIRAATVSDLMEMQNDNLFCLPENYQMKSVLYRFHMHIHTLGHTNTDWIHTFAATTGALSALLYLCLYLETISALPGKFTFLCSSLFACFCLFFLCC